ncbi:MAG: hypothetical protein EXS14_00425 [Planctomycetes bacterium]|nr:hypothetical protein [Planctomycetota bacterium]
MSVFSSTQRSLEDSDAGNGWTTPRSPSELSLALRDVLEQCVLAEQGLQREQLALQQRNQLLLVSLEHLDRCLREDSPLSFPEVEALERETNTLALAEQRVLRWTMIVNARLPVALALPAFAACGLVWWVGASAGLASLEQLALWGSVGLGSLLIFQSAAQMRCKTWHSRCDTLRNSALKLLATARMLPECAQPDAASLHRSALRWRAKLRFGTARTALAQLRTNLSTLPVLDDHLLPLRALCACAAADAAPRVETKATPSRRRTNPRPQQDIGDSAGA